MHVSEKINAKVHGTRRTVHGRKHTVPGARCSENRQEKRLKVDDLIRSPKRPFSVIPAHAGIQEYQGLLDPGLEFIRLGRAGVTVWKTSYEAIKAGWCWFPVNRAPWAVYPLDSSGQA